MSIAIAATLFLASPAQGQPNPLLTLPPPKSRFQHETPLPGLNGIMVDSYQTGWGLAQQAARAKGLQARVLWVDCTANIDRYNDDAKVKALVATIADAGFNTI